MRTKQEMLELILQVAQKDERVRAVGLDGSRTNPNVPKDMFQDYDIVYIVTDMQSFIDDKSWVDCFGERIIMQTPEDMAMFPPDLGGNFSYLMLFADGNRIDLLLCPLENKDNWNSDDKLAIVLLDKDESLPPLPAPTDEDFWVKEPSAAFFRDCCNEFWWVSTYVAKGLWRRELLYALDHLNLYVRPMLLKMLEWKVGIATGFSLSIGKNGKYLEQHLSRKEWQDLLATYPAGGYAEVWEALYAAAGLFRDTAKEVAAELSFTYEQEEDCGVMRYLQRVQQLDPEAKTIFQ